MAQMSWAEHYTKAEAARRLGKSEEWMRQRCRDGTFATVLVPFQNRRGERKYREYVAGRSLHGWALKQVSELQEELGI